MPERADLHLHTSYSDGAHTPGEVLRLAREAGLTAVSISDHDTVAGLPEASTEAASLGLRLIPGVEVSVAYEGEDIHVLAYFVDPQDGPLGKLLADLRRARRRRIRTMGARLRRLGFPLRAAQIWEQIPRGAPAGRPHLAAALAKAGWIENYGDAFRFYIGRDCPAYLANRTASPEETVRVILGAGGIPILAHPAVYPSPTLVSRFLSAGIMGLEVYHPRQTPEQTERLHRMAESLGLLETGGSDYHGAGRGDAPPGSCIITGGLLGRLEEARGSVPGLLRRINGNG